MAAGGAASATAGIAQQMAGEPVSVVVEEKLLVSLNKDGGVENMEVQGIMSLQARAPTLPASVGVQGLRVRVSPMTLT